MCLVVHHLFQPNLLLYCLSILWFFDTIILNIRLLILFYLSSEDIFILLWFFWNFSIFLAIFLPMKLVACAVFWMTLFEEVLSGSVADYLTWSRSVLLYLPLTFLLIFVPVFLSAFFAKDKNLQPFPNIWSLGWTE